MVQVSRPSPDNGYVLTTDEYEALSIGYAADGVWGQPTDTAVVYADSTGRQVKIRAGKRANVRGRLWKSDAATDEIVASLPANTSGNPRIDRLVARLDRSTGNITTAYIQGTPAATPVAPALTQSASLTAGQWDFPLARWNVANGYTTIAAVDLTTEAWYLNPGGPLLCNSTSRPFGGALTPGTTIFEVDTAANYPPGAATRQWNGTFWGWPNPVIGSVATTQSYVADTTFHAAVNLLFPTELNARYVAVYDLFYGAGNLGDLAFRWSLPGGCTIRTSIMGLPANANSGTTDPNTALGNVMAVNGSITNPPLIAFGGVGTSSSVPCYGGRVVLYLKTTTTAGFCQFQFGQSFSDSGSGTSLYDGSSMTAYRVG